MVPFFPACFSFSHILYALPATVDIWWQILNIVLIKFCSVQIVRVQWDTQLIMCKSNYLYPLFTKYQQKNMQNKGRFQWAQLPEHWGWESLSLSLSLSPYAYWTPPPFMAPVSGRYVQEIYASCDKIYGDGKELNAWDWRMQWSTWISGTWYWRQHEAWLLVYSSRIVPKGLSALLITCETSVAQYI